MALRLHVDTGGKLGAVLSSEEQRGMRASDRRGPRNRLSLEHSVPGHRHLVMVFSGGFWWLLVVLVVDCL